MPKRFGREIRTVRTPHGTRVLKTIVCSKCGKSDSLSFVPRGNQPVLCRQCAEVEMGVVEQSAVERFERTAKCRSCGEPTVQRLDEEALCHACELKEQAQRRKSASKPEGVHPLLVKRKPKET